MLALHSEAFDQGYSGWRSRNQPGCERVTADVIDAIARLVAGVADRVDRLFWHEAQPLAAGGTPSKRPG